MRFISFGMMAMMALGACAAQNQKPVSASMMRSAGGSPSNLTASTTNFDGTYEGVPEATGCRTWDHLTATISSGTFFMPANPATSLVFQGPVEADGTISAAGTNGTERLTGRVANGALEGVSVGLRCNFKVVMRRTSNSPDPKLVREATTLIQMCGATFPKPSISPVLPGTPANVAAFLGQWGDCSTEWIWQSGYGGGMPYAMFVTAVTPDGTAEISAVHGSYYYYANQPGIYRRQGKIVDDQLQYPVTNTDGYIFDRHGNTLYGTEKGAGSTISLVKK